MIKINLLGNETALDYGKQVLVGSYFASIALTLILCYVLNSSTAAEIELKTQEKSSKEVELKRWQMKTQEVKDLEKKQKELEERLVRIAILKRNKQGPVKVMDALNLAIPERAWLYDAREINGEFRLSGFAIDGETVSQFIRGLQGYEYFPEVIDLIAEQASIDMVKLQKFYLSMKLTYAGKVAAEATATPVPQAQKK